jgi:hypothetical protein
MLHWNSSYGIIIATDSFPKLIKVILTNLQFEGLWFTLHLLYGTKCVYVYWTFHMFIYKNI